MVAALLAASAAPLNRLHTFPLQLWLGHQTFCRAAVDECPGPFMTSAETVCFSCTDFLYCWLLSEAWSCCVSRSTGHGDHGSLLVTRQLILPRVQDRMCPWFWHFMCGSWAAAYAFTWPRKGGGEDLATPLFSTASGRCLRTDVVFRRRIPWPVTYWSFCPSSSISLPWWTDLCNLFCNPKGHWVQWMFSVICDLQMVLRPLYEPPFELLS